MARSIATRSTLALLSRVFPRLSSSYRKLPSSPLMKRDVDKTFPSSFRIKLYLARRCGPSQSLTPSPIDCAPRTLIPPRSVMYVYTSMYPVVNRTSATIGITRTLRCLLDSSANFIRVLRIEQPRRCNNVKMGVSREGNLPGSLRAYYFHIIRYPDP